MRRRVKYYREGFRWARGEVGEAWIGALRGKEGIEGLMECLFGIRSEGVVRGGGSREKGAVVCWEGAGVGIKGLLE